MNLVKLALRRSKITIILMVLFLVVLYLLFKITWHYLLLYLFFVLYLILVVLHHFDWIQLNPKKSKWILGIALTLLLGTVFLLLAFPTQKLPTPSGDFAIGTKTYELLDPRREEIYSETPDDHRKIKYQLWYPSDDVLSSKKEKWLSDGTLVMRALARNLKAPYFIFDHTARISSNSYIDAAISESSNNYPVVIISHGWKSFREMHTDFAEELASNGFIVVSIDHSYGSQAVKFDDGSVLYLNKEALPSISLPADFQESSKLIAKVYGEDVRSVMDDLERLNSQNTFFRDKIDLDAMGVLGHSTGGGGDVYAALKDDRIKSVLGLDAWVEPLKEEGLIEGLSIPSLFIRSEQWSDRANNVSLKELSINSKDFKMMQMDGTRHTDFTMNYMLSPLTQFAGFARMSDGVESSEVQREIILEFFDYTLRKSDNPDYFEDIVSKYGGLRKIDITK